MALEVAGTTPREQQVEIERVHEPGGTSSAQATREASIHHNSITPLQGVAIIFGTNIGAGILSLPYAAKDGGFASLVLALVIAGTLTTFSMLYVAEVALRTNKPLQLSGLTEKYLGQAGRWIVFTAVIINGVGALIAYASGSGSLIASLTGLPESVGTVVFFAAGAAIMWLGLQATGVVEGAITTAMAVILAVLIGWTLLGPGITLGNLWVFRPGFIIPIVNLAVFTFLAQYVVPELARGMKGHRAGAIPVTIVVGMCITGFTLAAVPFAALGLLGTQVTEVITLAWSERLGHAAFIMANIFALCAMMTSFIAIGFTTMRNVLDIFHWPEEGLYRHVGIAMTVFPPLIIFFCGFHGFVQALTYTGGFAGAIISIVPVMLLTAARRFGDVTPAWANTWQAHPLIRGAIIVVYGLAFVYAALSITGMVG